MKHIICYTWLIVVIISLFYFEYSNNKEFEILQHNFEKAINISQFYRNCFIEIIKCFDNNGYIGKIIICNFEDRKLKVLDSDGLSIFEKKIKINGSVKQ